ncbi:MULTISPECIES: GNAT family N-acetyltransferase [unclassified Streptomyces]|uniref:GNAT family N-acetyltransferase n=1 Tax=unclassified Streptomyces TaxID=2593676 RepID=UPI00070933D9|nr:GNAT family N-acetyltransferase [Streptomyces sp. Root1310]KQX77070.1 GCN5 family acetyltransferase [Streptomyces sp. Root1310]
MSTPSTHTDVVIRTYGPGQVAPLVDTVADLWADAHPEIVDTPGAATDGLSVPALRRQVLGHVHHHREGFTLVAAYAHGAMVGFGYAFPCTPEYWFGSELLPQIPESVRASRLMGLCELAVTPAWQGRGIGTRLHAALVTSINPEWSSLLVRPDNASGRSLYDRLGYRYAGPYRNEPDGPVYDLLLLRVESAEGLPEPRC